ncbi:MAG: ABC transporter permease [bacterium JZ-2024 1]
MKHFLTSAWLGWLLESNWTDPLLFAIYSIAKPLSSTLILFFIYFVATMGKSQPDFFAYLYLGNIFFTFVMYVLFGMSWTILADREFYETARYIYTLPRSYLIYLIGRAVVKFVLALISAFILLAFGMLAFHLPIRFPPSPLLFLLGFVIGIISLMGLGITIAGISLCLPRHSEMIGESVAGVFYLLCGAVFPPEYLPGFLQPVAAIIPFSHWLELLRRQLLPTSVSHFFSSYSDFQILLILSGSCALFWAVSLALFRLFDYIARKNGLVDRTTAW